MAEQTLPFEQYLGALPAGRRGEVEKVWRVVRGAEGGGGKAKSRAR